MKQNNFRPYWIRFLIVLAVSVAFTGAFNEGVYLLQKEKTDRAPQTIELVIPSGTAERVAAGESAVGIPEDMVFVLGDVLEVRNEDAAPHQLGPVWVPPGATGSLMMEKVDKLAYSCSFQVDQYLGVDVRQPTTLGTRLTGLLLSAPTMTALLFIYSLAAFPIGGKKTSPLSSEEH